MKKNLVLILAIISIIGTINTNSITAEADDPYLSRAAIHIRDTMRTKRGTKKIKRATWHRRFRIKSWF